MTKPQSRSGAAAHAASKGPKKKQKRTFISPADRKQGAGRINNNWRQIFLKTLAETSNVSASADEAGVAPGYAYRVRRNEPVFAAKWRASLLEGYEHLEMETLHRLRMGTGKDDPKFDVANALRLLVLHKETVARERARREARDEDTILASINAKIDAMRAREKEMAQMLAEDDGD